MSNRWTQEDDDSTRLPEGFERIGYDADTRRYTFRDVSGMIYEGEPGVRYGVMTPVPSAVEVVEKARPSAFARSPLRSSTLPARVSESSNNYSEKSPKTFQDFLPPELITSSTMSEAAAYSNSNSNSNPNSRIRSTSTRPLVDLVRKSTMPKVHGVVQGLRRSVTAIRRSRLRTHVRLGQDEGEEDREEEEEAESRRTLFSRRRSTVSHSHATSHSSVSVRSAGLDRSPSVSTTRTEMSRHSVIPVHPLRHS